MSALGAIVALGKSAPLTRTEVDSYVADHEDLLDSAVSERKLGSRSAAFLLGGGQHGAEEDRSSWALSLGAVYGAVRLVGVEPTELEGQFALVTHDADSDQTRLIADPFGMQRFYVATRPGRLYASSSALAMARHLGAVPDRLGIETFLATGGQFGWRTMWDGVERLEPGVVVEITGGDRHDRVYWAPSVDPEWRDLSFDVSTARHTEALTSALERNLAGAGTMLADLTGGFDSRLLALALRRAGVSVVTQTAGGRDDPDVVIAQRIARELDLPWRPMPRRAPPNADAGLRAIDEAAAWGDGHLDVLNALPVLEGFKSHSRDFGRLVNGGGGEHLRFYAWAQESYRAGRSSRVNYSRWINLRVLSPLDVRLLRDDPLPAVRRDAEERMRPVAARYSDQPNTVQLDAMYAYRSTGHFGAWTSLARRYLDLDLPYYWKSVFNGAFSTSYRYRNHNRLVRHMIAGLDPSIARLTTQRGGPAEPWRASNLHRFVPFYARQVRNLVPHLSNRMLGRPLLAAQGADGGVDETLGLLPALRDDGTLDVARMRSGALYDPARLNEVLEQSAKPGAASSPLLGRIITVERALRLVDAGIT